MKGGSDGKPMTQETPVAFEGEKTGERRPRGAGRVARPGVRGAKAGVGGRGARPLREDS